MSEHVTDVETPEDNAGSIASSEKTEWSWLVSGVISKKMVRS